MKEEIKTEENKVNEKIEELGKKDKTKKIEEFSKAKLLNWLKFQ